jgi:hypothetical protein
MLRRDIEDLQKRYQVCFSYLAVNKSLLLLLHYSLFTFSCDN